MFKQVGSIYKLPVTGSAVAYSIPELATVRAQKMRPIIRVQPSCGTIFKLGAGSGVTASDVADGTTKALVADNERVAGGIVEVFQTISTDNYISVISDDHTTTGTMWLSIGYEMRENAGSA